jgi:hypothetical protein
MSKDMIAPVLALVIWSLVMLGWAVTTRLGALKSAGIDLANAAPGGRGGDLDRVLPGPAQWPAHNYNHLMEQPTIFYATAIAIAMIGAGDPLNVALAWGYVATRVVHSVYQAKVNVIRVRMILFSICTTLLGILAVRGLLAALA